MYGYPIRDATPAVFEQVAAFLDGPSGDKVRETLTQIDFVVFCCFSAKDLDVYREAAPRCLA